MKKKYSTFFLLLSLICSTSSSASSLLQVYQDAFDNDPTFKAARASWRASRENFPIALSVLLPQFDVKAGLSKIHTRVIPSTIVKTKNTQKTYTLTLSQTLFNYTAWANVSSAKATVKQAFASFNAAYQDLIFRTAEAYFNVLNAYDDLRYTITEEKAVARQLEQTRERYKVGLISITDVYEAQAKYEGILANKIAAENTLENKLEELREITGNIYPRFMGITKHLPLISPKPTSIQQWVNVAVRQNYSLLSAYHATRAAKENISVQQAGHLPTLNAVGGYTYTRDSNNPSMGVLTTSKIGSVGLDVDFPVLQGGFVVASARQASYLYQAADAEREKTLRSTMALTRKAYLGVLSGISQIKALRRSIISNESALKAAEAAYVVGTRTIIDVLDAQTALYDAQRKYSSSEYNYLLDTLRLKQAAGTLKPDDLEKINTWLNKRVILPQNHLLSSEKERHISKIALGRKRTSQLPKKHTAGRKKWKATTQNNLPYTIQLFSTPDRKEAVGFIQMHHLVQKAHVIQGKYKNTMRYQVRYGQYKTVKDATIALERLPLALKRFKPWVRREVFR